MSDDDIFKRWEAVFRASTQRWKLWRAPSRNSPARLVLWLLVQIVWIGDPILWKSVLAIFGHLYGTLHQGWSSDCMCRLQRIICTNCTELISIFASIGDSIVLIKKRLGHFWSLQKIITYSRTFRWSLENKLQRQPEIKSPRWGEIIESINIQSNQSISYQSNLTVRR